MPRRNALFACFLLCQIVAVNLFAEDETASPSAPDKSLEQIFEEVRLEFKLPALAGGIVTSNGIKEIAAVGKRKLGDDTAVTIDDLWHLGSCTKAMTATLVGILVSEGKLNWETTLADLFPEDASEMEDAFQTIHLTHLLTHRSGLPANGTWRALGAKLSPTQQRHELLRRMMKQPLLHEPGSKFLYSNVGYALAGLMAETVTGASWESLIQEKLFHPLGMSQVGFGIPGTIDQTDQPWGHHSTFLGLGPLKPIQADNASSLGPAGTVHASLHDWAKFIALHLNAEQKVLPPEIWTQLHTTPADADYALGWAVVERPWSGGEALTHSGSNTVNFCVCWLAPKKDFGVIVVTNTGQANAALALDKAASLLIGRHLQ
jgi:CubicO group peptidase (beta-lactamase class C family)